ncbi:hypothetical protein GCM10010387_15620 [Streptomyces inusitatus]|uniref:Uncharacterized protein n=1 Tax=Streptomyces inusitatus TaxID=68221 RepID=A0A918PUN4_9ACTN|nr:hypothetical protein [Streptomyces inusitatus]GGZ23357.1 hypothetical protein GCM10010387_15620 [Streptomyces inusitatus]
MSSRPLTELPESGLLWLINRSVFHPRGLALALDLDEHGHVHGWQLLQAAPGEPFEFTDDVDRAGFQRAEATLLAVREEATARG